MRQGLAWVEMYFERMFWSLLYSCWSDCLQTLWVFKPIHCCVGIAKNFVFTGSGNHIVALLVGRVLILMSMRDRDSIYGEQFRRRVKSLGAGL